MILMYKYLVVLYVIYMPLWRKDNRKQKFYQDTTQQEATE